MRNTLIEFARSGLILATLRKGTMYSTINLAHGCGDLKRLFRILHWFILSNVHPKGRNVVDDRKGD